MLADPNPGPSLDLRLPTRRGLDWLKSTDPAQLVSAPGQGWWHAWGYGDVTGRMVEAFVLARRTLGESGIGPEEERIRRFLDSLFDAPDGLCWRPESAYRRRAAHMFDPSSALFGLVAWFTESGERSVADRSERLIDALRRIAEWRGDWCFYPLEVYTPTGWTAEYDEFRDGRRNVPADPCHEGGRQIAPLVDYYTLTGHEPALRLAEGLTRFEIRHSGVFAADGSYLERQSRARGHVHSRLGTAAGVAKLGLVTGRPEWTAWAKSVFDWTLCHLASSFGWVSERAHESAGGCETCAITDALDLALILAENGHPEYWDIAECFARNHLLKSQCPRTGGFSGHTMPNDYCWLYHDRLEHHVGGCCSPAGIRALWLVWERIVARQGDEVAVHFPLDRNSPWVDVASELPYRGRVTVSVHDAPMLRMRLPDWVLPAAVRLAVNGKPRNIDVRNRHIRLAGLVRGDELAVEFPVRRARLTESFIDFTFDVTWQGDTVVAIDPPGEHEPLYRQRK